MIELERHIEILLLSNDCVIVPELGGFMAHHVDARYDTSDSMFLPPLRTLGFNPQLTMNDSLLVQSYIEAYDMSYPEALRRIESEVAELKQHLDAEGAYELNDIGMLRLNDEGHIEFEPCEAGILTPSLYGLSSFGMPMLSKRQQEKAAATAEPAKKVLARKQPAETTEEETLSATDDAIVIKMSWVRNIAAVAAAVVCLFLLTSPLSNNQITKEQMQQSAFFPMVKKDTLKHPAAATPAKLVHDTLALQASTAEKADSTTKTDSASTAGVNTGNARADEASATQTTQYVIVLASQTTQKLADDFVARLQESGFSDARVSNNGKMVRVVMGAYSSEAEAHDALRRHRSNDSKHWFTEAWVLHSSAAV